MVTERNHTVDTGTHAWTAALLQSVGVAIVSADRAGLIVSWNAAAEALYGWSAAEAIGQSYLLTCDADGLDSESAIFDGALSGVAAPVRGSQRRDKAGQLVRTTEAVSPITEAGGLVCGVSWASVAESDTRRVNKIAAVVESHEVAIISIARNGLVQAWNPGAEHLYGWTSAEMLGQPVNILVPEDERAVKDEMVRRTLGGESLPARAVRRRHKGGHFVTVSMSTWPIRDSTGAIVAMAASARQVSSGRQAYARLAAFMGSSQDAVIGTTPTGQVVSWNLGAQRLYGWTAEEMVGRDFTVLIPDHQHPIEAALFSRTANGEHAEAVTLIRRTKVGDLLEVSVAMAPVIDLDGTVTGVVSSSRDASERRRLEAGFQRILEAAPDAIVCVDRAGTMTFVNARIEELFGYRPDELIGRPVETLVPASSREGHADRRATYLQNPRPRPMGGGQQLYGLRKDGSTFPADISLNVIEGADGTMTIAAVRDVTERHAIEEALRDSQGLLHQLASNTEAGVYLRNPTDMLYVNAGFRRIFGLEPSADPLDLPDLPQAIHAEDRERVMSGLLPGESVQMEFRIVLPTGEIRWVRLTHDPVRDAEGNPYRIAGTVIDITDLKSTEAALRDSQERLQQLASNNQVGFFLRSPEEMLYVNSGFRRIFDIDRETEAVNIPDLFSMIHPEDLERASRDMTAGNRGESTQTDVRILLPSGELRWIRATADPVLDDAGEAIRAAGTIMDITELKNVERALLESEERFLALTNALDVGVNLRRLNPPEYLFTNEAFRRITGLSADGGEPSFDEAASLLHPDDRERVLHEYLPRVQAGESAESEHRIVLPTGSVRWLRTTSTPVSDPFGVVNRIAGTVEDVTPRKVAEAAVESARREAERANSAKSEFLSRMSHELRTPLNAVLGFAQLLEMDALTDSQQSSVHHILQGGRHLLEMINDVLDISRIETDQLELSIEPVPVTELIDEVVGLMLPLANAALVTIEVSASDQTHFVRADRRRLRQVLLNLLSNAIKYNKRGGRVTIAEEADDYQRLWVRVTDSGMGIRPTDLPRLFTPFDRLGTHSAEIEGTGIGLALSQRLAQIMGGAIEVESIVGEGSTFSAVLQLVAPPDFELSEGHLPGQAVDVPAQHQATLLYIEDNGPNVQLVERILDRRPAWTMVHAGHGALGLELAESLLPNLILLDVHLPDLSGLDVLHRLRAEPATTNIPVVVVSADASQHQIERLLAAGAVDYLTKPLNIGEVLQMIDDQAAGTAP